MRVITCLSNLGTLGNIFTYVSGPLPFRNVIQGLFALPSGCCAVLSQADGLSRGLAVAPTSNTEVTFKAKVRRNFVRIMHF